MLTAEEIENGKAACRQIVSNPLYGSDDCIRIAYEWLDAQQKLKQTRSTNPRPLKHMIEKWGGQYISQADVEVAAHLHPGIIGRYPNFNISARLIEPCYSRLGGIGQVSKHNDDEAPENSGYVAKENRRRG